MFIMQWVPGTYPIPFFQTWCCENSSITPSPGNWHDLKSAGLPPKMYDCVRDNLLMNRVGVDCIHYLFNDDECRAFIAREYPSDVLDAYDNLIPTAFKADLWRYCVLYMYGGVYLDIKLQFCGGVGGGGGGGGAGVSLRSIVERWTSGDGCGGDGGDGGDGGGGGDGLFVLERDAVGLWSPGRFGIHNAFIITKPKNPILLECIFRIVSASKVGGVGGGCWGGTGAYDVGWMTRPLFVTGPGLLGDVWRWWRSRQSSGGGGGGDGGDVPDSYATMAPYFRFFFEGDGRIGYFMGDGRYVQLLKVYDGYRDEYNHIAVHHVPHYTVLWSRGVVWGFRPPATGYCSAFAERSVAATLDRPKGASPRKT
jgi:hypothetical protein